MSDNWGKDHGHKLTRYEGKPWPDMDFYDVVRLNCAAPEEVRGELGYIVGWGPESDPPGLGVFIYGIERVWSLDYEMASPMGYKDDIAAANAAKARSLRVSSKGELP